MSVKQRSFDIIVFGATGYTGNLAANYLSYVSLQEKFTWALAGRNVQKLESVRNQLSKNNGAVTPELLQADVNDEASISTLAKSATVIITTVGPYAKYGEPLLKACAKAGTHYVDLTGEPNFVQAMRQKYDAIAQKTSAKIVNSCGFESIPPDMAVLYAVNLLKERLGANNVANAKVVVHGAAEGFSMPSGGTWHSAVEAMAGARQWMRERKPLQSHRVGSINTPILYEKNWQRWALNAPTIDPDVVCYSAHLRGDYGKHFSYGHFIAAKQPFKLAGMVAGMSVVFTLAQFTPTKNWLLKQRQSGDGPSQDAREKGWFNMHVTAQAAGEKVVVRLSGGDPFYGDTAKMLSQAALCLALDKNLPETTGIITPAAAMGEALIPRLERAGLVFSAQL
jgi:short subunit dehydrogenase-like uncharacterized protein